jgi:hypothetical protein
VLASRAYFSKRGFGEDFKLFLQGVIKWLKTSIWATFNHPQEISSKAFLDKAIQAASLFKRLVALMPYYQSLCACLMKLNTLSDSL